MIGSEVVLGLPEYEVTSVDERGQGMDKSAVHGSSELSGLRRNEAAAEGPAPALLAARKLGSTALRGGTGNAEVVMPRLRPQLLAGVSGDSASSAGHRAVSA